MVLRREGVKEREGVAWLLIFAVRLQVLFVLHGSIVQWEGHLRNNDRDGTKSSHPRPWHSIKLLESVPPQGREEVPRTVKYLSLRIIRVWTKFSIKMKIILPDHLSEWLVTSSGNFLELASEMAEWIKVLTTKPCNLSLISGTNMVERDKQC